MTDADSNTPFEEHDYSIDFDTNYDGYGLHERDGSTVVIRIDNDTHVFERVGMIERRSSGVVLKEHAKLTDEVSGDAIETYQPIRFVSNRTAEFETQLQDAILSLIYDGEVAEGVAKELCAELAENLSC